VALVLNDVPIETLKEKIIVGTRLSFLPYKIVWVITEVKDSGFVYGCWYPSYSGRTPDHLGFWKWEEAQTYAKRDGIKIWT
jgi:hypothetical protein